MSIEDIDDDDDELGTGVVTIVVSAAEGGC